MADPGYFLNPTNLLSSLSNGLMHASGLGFLNNPTISNWLEQRHAQDFGQPSLSGAVGDSLMAANMLPIGRGLPRPVQQSTMDSLRQIAEDTTQQGVRNLLGLDQPLPQRTHAEYVLSKTKKMSPEQILDSDALWAASRDLAAQKNIPMSQAFSDLGAQVIGRPLTAEEFANQMTQGARFGLLSPRRLYE